MAASISPFATDFPEMSPVPGVELATAHSGMRYKNRDDLLLATFAERTQVAGVLTQNTIPGEPVKWCRSILPEGRARALLVNAGIANVLTGPEGYRVVETCAKGVSGMLECPPEQVYVNSTGVIGEPVPTEPIIGSLKRLCDELGESSDHWHRAARAIMTTDTFAKGVTRKAHIGPTEVTINGIIKGSGMVAPNMATMLGYVFTDAAIPAPVLQRMLNEDKEVSYHAITVDSDMSTSDSVLVFATGKAHHWEISEVDAAPLTDFREKLREVHQELAQLVVRDGEGISKLLTIKVQGAENNASARKIGLSIANSPLVKTAVAGADPNWGRIGMAIGKSGQPIFREKLSIWIGKELVLAHDRPHPDYREAKAAEHMQQKEVEFTVDVGVGHGEATVWTSDLTHGYIDINADYRS